MSRVVTVEEKLKESISSTLSDYRHVPPGGMNAEHVSRWIDQFDPADRRFILEETDRILSRGYIAKKDYKRIIRELVEDEKNKEVFDDSAFLNIQEDGFSQNELIEELGDKYPDELYTVTRESSRRWVTSFKRFIYFDDVCFSGRKAYDDLSWLIYKFDLKDVKILLHFLSGHTFASWNIRKEIESAFPGRNISIIVNEGEFGDVENRLKYNASSGVFWPVEQNVIIPKWINEPKKFTGACRDGFVSGDDFPDERRRNKFESILTATGFEILRHSDNIKKGIKPLGFSTFPGVGFGGTTFTYRNCPNNVPLAFWWGNYERSGGRALACWYPLMKRIVYNR
ncbi:hypothetical protein NB069_08730 [Leclercia adecarboxylata]|uniref:phosphoribosyltransferase-like protein n=1 Tax=Leclercia adecarboxylata TaxID=83655 RepID=UPI00202A6790|nr:hypothetical protein [Leclercia adecarboxylata]URO00934.1 hypothetical protein NB069_08730 [Leclercia adecarboxylata]